MQEVPRSIIINKGKKAENTLDLEYVPKQQLIEDPEIVTRTVTNEVIEDRGLFPKSIHIEDIDQHFIDWVKSLNYTLNNETVNVQFFSLQRFGEFMRNFSKVDEKLTTQLPILTITKETPAKFGTLLGTTSKILPNDEKFPLYRIPKNINGETIYEYIMVPQHTYIDLQYKINAFVVKQRDINIFNELMINQFKKVQNLPLNVYGHNMELELEDISINNQTSIEERRYYRQNYVINLKGFLYDENNFTVSRSLNRIDFSVEGGYKKNVDDACFYEYSSDGLSSKTIEFIFKKRGKTNFIYKANTNFLIDSTNRSFSDTDFEYILNDSNVVNIPFNVNKGDKLSVNYVGSPLIKNITLKLYVKKL
jgi:hypothetical protein